MQRRKLLHQGLQALQVLAGATALAAPWAVRAQTWPNKPLRLIVPFPPGGTTDNVSRLVALELGKSLGQAVVVDNKPGAGTVIGVDAAAKAAPDGNTLVCIANSYCVNQTLIKKRPYSAQDLRPVALMGLSEHVLVTHPGSGLRTVADIAAVLRTKPGSLSYASFGQGTSAHLAGEMLKLQLGVDIVHVPYKGQAPALSDVLGGQVSMMFGNWPEFRSHVESGKLVALGMATAHRSVYAPAMPTLVEQDIKVESNSWNGILAPAGTPDAVVQRLNVDINKALAAPSVTEAFQRGGITSQASSSEQFAKFIHSEISRYADVIRKANITAES